jgi:hypothetical protein
METKTPKLEEIYDRIEAEERREMSQIDGYQWGIEYLQDVIKQIERLEQRALERNDPSFYNNVKLSAQRAKEAEQELRNKLHNMRNLP